MSDERLIQLLSARADAVLAPGEREELDALLAASPDADRLAGQFLAMDELLAAAPVMEPPADLADRIVSGVRLPPKRPATRAAWWRRLATPAVLGYGLAAAAGGLLVLALYETHPALLEVPDLAQVMGALSSEADSGTVLDRHRVESNGVSSVAELVRRDGALVFDLRVDAQSPLHVEVDLGDHGLSFAALMQAPGVRQTIRMEGSRLGIDSEGRQRIVVLLHGDERATRTAELRLAYSRDGRTFDESVLRTERQVSQ